MEVSLHFPHKRRSALAPCRIANPLRHSVLDFTPHSQVRTKQSKDSTYTWNSLRQALLYYLPWKEIIIKPWGGVGEGQRGKFFSIKSHLLQLKVSTSGRTPGTVRTLLIHQAQAEIVHLAPGLPCVNCYLLAFCSFCCHPNNPSFCDSCMWLPRRTRVCTPCHIWGLRAVNRWGPAPASPKANTPPCFSCAYLVPFWQVSCILPASWKTFPLEPVFCHLGATYHTLQKSLSRMVHNATSTGWQHYRFVSLSFP